MKILSDEAKLVCKHELGRIKNKPSQDWVRINGHSILIENDPEGRDISGCPNIGVTIKPCQHTLKVDAGYSSLLRVDGKRICLDSVTGFTDGTPPGVVKYKVNDPGQELVTEGS